MHSPFFWNLIARRYARSDIADPATYETKLAMTQGHLNPDMRLLEIGCGTGSTALRHAPKVASILALDFSAKMIEIAKEKARTAAVANVEFRTATLDALPVPAPADAFDAGLALSFLHLVPDPTAALRQLAAQIRPGGLLFTSTACVGDMKGLVPYLLPLMRLTVVMPSVTRVTESSLRAAHTDAGFEVMDKFRPAPDAAVFLIAKRLA